MLKEELNLNPAVKKGDTIIVLKSNNNGDNTPLNKVLVVTTNQKVRTKTNFVAKDEATNTCYNIYYSGPSDEFIMATRKDEALYLRLRNEQLLKEIDENNVKIDFLEKYATEEDYVADKLEAILTAHAGSKVKSVRTKAIADILKTLKTSELL